MHMMIECDHAENYVLDLPDKIISRMWYNSMSGLKPLE